MSEATPEKQARETEHGLDITRKIRKLTISDELERNTSDQDGTAILLCRDSDARKWGPRWLRHSGIQVTVPSDPAHGLELLKTRGADIVIVEAGLIGSNSRPVFEILATTAEIDADIVVLCNNQREMASALDAGVFDVARKPFQWQLIGLRAACAMRLRKEKLKTEELSVALQEALNVAHTAHSRLRSHERVEPVTGLPNRTRFMDLLRRGMRASDRDATELAVIVIGFTRFRLVIEAMGQEHADQVLARIGQHLDDCLNTAIGDTDPTHDSLRTAAIASLDQFRFGMMLTVAENENTTAVIQQRLLESLSRPIHIAGQAVHLSVCLGVALYPQDASDVDSLLQRADNAMRDAQSRGGGFKYYCGETDAAAARKLKLEHMLHEALDREELTLAYQPIVDVQTNAIRTAEALLRWRQPDGRYIPPEEFVAVAEESGLMIRTGEFAVATACAQLAAWRRNGLQLPYICVNVAKVQLMSNGFARSIERILKKHRLQPGDLELEISERGVLSGDYDVIRQLHELKHLGVKLSVDDFGTGDSAISYLKELPVDVLKIDRSYIAGLADDGKEAAIASAMVAFGQRLNLGVVAEGVETEAQLKVLKELRCDSYQGFLAAEPLEPAAFAEFERQANLA